jgi:hypothetical protein
MSPLPEELVDCTLEQLLASQGENRAWSKDLRLRAKALVNSRLANEISLADYLESRKAAQSEAAECQRRAFMLDEQIVRYSMGTPLVAANG